MKLLQRPILFLAIATLITAGGSILFLSYTAEKIGTDFSVQYPVFQNPPPGERTSMSGEYVVLAQNIVDRGIFSRNTGPTYEPDAWRTPGYPIFIAPFYWLFGDNLYPVLIAQVIAVFLTVLLIFTMARRLMSNRWALALSTIYLLLPTTLLSASILLTETLFTFLFILSVYLLLFSEWKHMYLRWAIAGILLAVAAYVRPAGLYIVPFFLAGYFLFYLKWPEISRKHIVAAVFLIITFAGTLLPWFVRNQIEFEHFTFASTGSFVLFRQNAVQFYEAYNDVSNIEARYTLQDRAGIPRGKVPEGFEYSEVMKDVAVEVIIEHPLAYTYFHFTSFVPFFTSSGAQNYERYIHNMLPNYNPPEEPSLIQAVHPFSLPTLIVVLKNHGWTLVENALWALVTLLVLISLWWSKNTRLARMFFVLMMYFALVTGPIAHARYRMPVEPLILVSAFSALVMLWPYWRSKIVEKFKLFSK